jgi:hypothetical protein
MVALLSILLSFNGFAETKNSKETSRRTEVINFEDELVEGQNTKPELFYLLQQKNFNYKRLIKLRENFVPEAKRSFENLQLNRGNN